MEHPFLNRFSPWKAWRDRDSISGICFPGIYALAISDALLTAQKFSFLSEIAYFGMTNAVSGLRGRLKQFDNTIRGKSGHGGADRFRHDFPRALELERVLYVAAMPVECSVITNDSANLRLMGQVAMAEYECFAQHVQLYGGLPKYNDKKNAPKLPRSRQ